MFHTSDLITDKTKVEVLLDGGVQELDLLPESLRLLVQLSSLLLHLADVLSRLLQRGGFADLSRQTRGGLEHVSDSHCAVGHPPRAPAATRLHALP